ncbi:hypothetical protein HII28_16155 [Planctomonas sp. JC2975]|uniref:hypothetical protein n=1 Tax=Planctomonas sp. JC2975 TaxID=2729626 RepID=UPI001472CDE2|nr:hypothetical protein [Planctomonas sp. JC2975]NNC13405.1 hypothetical protein [Planctomonas sp. JC2975]
MTLAVAGSEAATTAAVGQPLSFDQAILFAEFEGDDGALSEMRWTAEYPHDQLIHRVPRLRMDRANAAKCAEVTAQLEADGIRVVASDGDFVSLHRLIDAAAAAGVRPELDPEAHAAACPGHAVYVKVFPWADEATITPVCTTQNAHQPLSSYGHGTDEYAVPTTGE